MMKTIIKHSNNSVILDIFEYHESEIKKCPALIKYCISCWGIFLSISAYICLQRIFNNDYSVAYTYSLWSLCQCMRKETYSGASTLMIIFFLIFQYLNKCVYFLKCDTWKCTIHTSGIVRVTLRFTANKNYEKY